MAFRSCIGTRWWCGPGFPSCLGYSLPFTSFRIWFFHPFLQPLVYLSKIPLHCLDVKAVCKSFNHCFFQKDQFPFVFLEEHQGMSSRIIFTRAENGFSAFLHQASVSQICKVATWASVHMLLGSTRWMFLPYLMPALCLRTFRQLYRPNFNTCIPCLTRLLNRRT